MKNIYSSFIPLSVIIAGLLILYTVGSGVTPAGSWREFIGSFVIAVGIFIAVWIISGYVYPKKNN